MQDVKEEMQDVKREILETEQDIAPRTQTFQAHSSTQTLPRSIICPPMDVPSRPVTAQSPFDIDGVAYVGYVTHVRDVEVFLQQCRQMIDWFDDLMQKSEPRKKEDIRVILKELAGKVKEGARAQAIGECSLQVAAPLYLVFEVIIPVM